ncbi:YhgE/Pip domain-containing protein [Spongiactinospora rosea]|uniref:YhgE/Pip domain-containing protein n=1 Tax=Spongiactinospora rosea TaxID=2248750 RepID=A0A366LND8_9ACTN|nr:YhgE/Pip domain-containing protein [Spongiactinospora rosea]RBQ14939.1 YhgE/Pip domain-containing protein [Spongiactinospora rosea]
MPASLLRALQGAFPGTSRPRTWLGLVLVPVLVAGLLTWAFWSPLTNHGVAAAAVVNLDEPVKVGEQLVPLGRQLADNLVNGDDKRYQWTLTDEEDAREGLRDGKYAAVVTVPRAFSARATSYATAEPMDATQATLQVETSPSAGLADPRAGRDVADAAVKALNTQVVRTYLDNVYVGFATLHEQMGEAADGADRLADGTGDLATGTRKLATGARGLAGGLGDLTTGSAQLAQGTGQAATGSARLATAAGQLSTGARQLANGTGRLADGATKLAGGLGKAARDTRKLPAATRKLADGARQVANGNRRLSDTAGPIADRIIDAIDDLPSADSVSAELNRLAEQCRRSDETEGDDFCAGLSQAADRLSAIAGDIDGMKARARSGAAEIKQSLGKLAGGAEQVADGTAQLATQSKALVGGIATAATGAKRLGDGIKEAGTGARKLSTGASALSQGATTLASGASRLDAGARRLATGAAQAAQGAKGLATGATRLYGGASQAEDGATALAKGLTDGLDQVPDYDETERRHLSEVAATPVAAPAAAGDELGGPVAAAFFLVFALWAGALATYLVIRAVPPFALTSRLSTWRLAGQAVLPGATVALVTGALLALGLAPFLDLGPGAALALLGVTLPAALSFTLLGQGLVALLGRTGHLIALAVLVLTLATGTLSSIPAPLAALQTLLPTHGAVTALRAVVTGADTGLAAGLAHLVLWLLVGLAATIFATERRRTLSPRRLRLDSRDLEPI